MAENIHQFLLIFMTAQIKGCIIKSIDQIPMIYVNDNIYLNDIDKLQQVLYKSKTIPQLKEALKEYKGQYGITDKSLDDLFEFYL